MYVVLLAAGHLNRSPAYPIQDDYASNNTVLRELETLLRIARATGSTAGHHRERNHVCATIIIDAALRGCSARFTLYNIRSLTVSTMVTTRSMAHDTRHATRPSHKNRKTICYGDLCTYKSTPAGKPHLRFSASHITHHDPNLTKLQRTGITAAPLDWLPDVIRTHCQTVIERYEEVISQTDENVVLDGVRHHSIWSKLKLACWRRFSSQQSRTSCCQN